MAEPTKIVKPGTPAPVVKVFRVEAGLPTGFPTKTTTVGGK
jgi:hypothetical protein